MLKKALKDKIINELEINKVFVLRHGAVENYLDDNLNLVGKK